MMYPSRSGIVLSCDWNNGNHNLPVTDRPIPYEPILRCRCLESFFSNRDSKWGVGRIVAASLFVGWMLVMLLILASWLIPVSGGART